MTVRALSRRRFTRSLGILAASVALTPPPAFGQKAGALPFSLGNNKRLKGWVRLEQDKTVTVHRKGRAWASRYPRSCPPSAAAACSACGIC